MSARDIGLFAASGLTGPLNAIVWMQSCGCNRVDAIVWMQSCECNHVNAIVDVPGVAVGHPTRIAGDGPLAGGSGRCALG